MNQAEQDADLLYGVRAIAGFLKMKEHQARHRIEAGQIPTFKIGGTICAARSGLNRWFAEQHEAAARQPRPAPEPAAVPQAPAAVRPAGRRRGR